MAEKDDTPETIKQTPFHKFHEAAGAKMAPFAGFMMPIQYTGITNEHLAVRNRVGMFDISHMGEIEVTGPDALKFIQKMTVNDASKLKPGDIQYSCLCYDDGGIVDDLLVYRLEDRYLLVVNAANTVKDANYLRDFLSGEVWILDITNEIGLLAIQGPKAKEVVSKMFDYDFDRMGYYHSDRLQLEGQPVLISRTGYTGEDGFEIYLPEKMADMVWNRAREAGRQFDMELVGLGARDTLRLEMKMALYGNDIDRTTNPIEAGLSWIVSFDKGDFIGRDALLKQKEEKPSRRLVCLELEGRAFPRHGYEVVSESRPVGKVTSGTFSPSLKKPIALAYVPRALAKPGRQVEVTIRDRQFPAVVVKPPFYKEGSHK